MDGLPGTAWGVSLIQQLDKAGADFCIGRAVKMDVTHFNNGFLVDGGLGKGDRNDFVQTFLIDGRARAKREKVGSGQKVVHGGAVIDIDSPADAVEIEEGIVPDGIGIFAAKYHAAAVAEHPVGIEILPGDRPAEFQKRVFAGDNDLMRQRTDTVVRDPAAGKPVEHVFSFGGKQVNDAELSILGVNIVDGGVGPIFADGKLEVWVVLMLLQKLQETIEHQRGAYRGDAEMMGLFRLMAKREHAVSFIEHPPRMQKKLRAFLGEGDAVALAQEDRVADFIFNFPDNFAQMWLGEEQGLRSLGDGTLFHSCDDVTQMLKFHADFLRMYKIAIPL